MERKIGEIFEYNGEWYQCVECDSCGKCSLRTTECGSGTKSDLTDEVFGECSKIRRSESKHVIFKKLEKVGEPFIGKVHIQLQRYKIYTEPIIDPAEKFGYVNEKNTIAIEIKQTKEDMGEYKMYDAKEDIPEFDKVVDECLFGKQELKLKPFDLQKAREGKPVYTRDGRKARIICFDRVTNSTNEYTGHLIVLVTNPNGDEQSFYYTEKGNLAGEDEYDNHKWDLMMLPEKKEGWVNVYKGGLLDTKSYNTKKEAFDKASPEDYVDTIKINWEE